MAKKFNDELSEIGGQTPNTFPPGVYLGVTAGMQKVGNNIPDNVSEPSGTGWYPEKKDGENIEKGESL